MSSMVFGAGTRAISSTAVRSDSRVWPTMNSRIGSRPRRTASPLPICSAMYGCSALSLTLSSTGAIEK
ncbi:hypothetical protein D3C71_1765990 [compost metagenome]